jgi:hypothetical protein
MNALSNVVSILFSIFMFVFGAISWQAETLALQKGAESVKWPTAKAHIRTGRVDIEKHHRNRGQGEYETYEWVVTYDYKVGGKTYSGSRISYATGADHHVADAILTDKVREAFAVGTTHPVRYNPKDPGDAVLIAGVEPEHALLSSLFLLSMSLGVFVLGASKLASGRPERSWEDWGLAIPMLLLFAFGFFCQPMVVRALVPPHAVIASLSK